MERSIFTNCRVSGGGGGGFYFCNGAQVDLHGTNTAIGCGMHGMIIDSSSSVRNYGQFIAKNNRYNGILVEPDAPVEPKISLEMYFAQVHGLIELPSLDILRDDLLPMLGEIEYELGHYAPSVYSIRSAVLNIANYLKKVTQRVRWSPDFATLCGVAQVTV